MSTWQLSGEEALAQGAWEGGVMVAAGYPGSPSTRFLEHLAEISKPAEVYAEWAANEKVAFEIALGASMGGKRAAVAMKSVGLNVAMDPLMVANIGGISGGLVVVLGDDPGAWASQNEQDSRLLVQAAQVPLLEFGSPQEAYDMAKYSFSLSEKFELPVFIRMTRASSSEKGTVSVTGERLQYLSKSFESLDSWKLFPICPPEKHKALHAKLPQIAAEFNGSAFNRQTFKSPKGILAAGYMAAKISLLLQGKDGELLSLFKLGTLYPPPEKELTRFLVGMEEVLVVEELQPMVEGYVRAMIQRHHLNVRVYGKETGHFPRHGEIRPCQIQEAIRDSLKVEIGSAEGPMSPERDEASKVLYKGLPPQCPYFKAFEAFSPLIPRDPKEKPVFVGDDGCLIRLMNQPFSLLNCKFCMGSAIGIASGLALAGEKRKIIALVGDSSFFHTGLPAYFNAVASGMPMMIILLDNRCTAMTGCQGNPGTDMNLQGRRRKMISIESVLKSSGLKVFRSVDAYGDKEIIAKAFRECWQSEDLSVLLVTGPCPNLNDKIC